MCLLSVGERERKGLGAKRQRGGVGGVRQTECVVNCTFSQAPDWAMAWKRSTVRNGADGGDAHD